MLLELGNAACLLAAMALALRLAWCDWRWRRLPNSLVLLLALLSIPYAVLQSSPPAWLAALVILLFGSWLFALGLCGAGDIKLLAAIALWLPGQVGVLLIWLAVFGLLLTVMMLLLRRKTVPYGCAMLMAATLLL